MSTTYTNPHTVEVAHDTELLSLLRERRAAHHTADSLGQALRSVAAIAMMDDGSDIVCYWHAQYPRFPLAELPVGTIVSIYHRRLGTLHKVKNADGTLSTATVKDAIDAPMDKGNPDSGTRRDRMVVDFDAAVVAARLADQAVVEHEKAYTGWNRYIAVLGGHVHRDMNCSTCYPTTMYAPVPSLAATTPDQAIALVGSTMCSVCFPLAPVDQTTGKLTEAVVNVLINEGDAAFRAKLAEIAAKAAEKCQAAPFDHDRSHAHLYRPYATCNGCGARVSLTSTLKMRAHKAPKADS